MPWYVIGFSLWVSSGIGISIWKVFQARRRTGAVAENMACAILEGMYAGPFRIFGDGEDHYIAGLGGM